MGIGDEIILIAVIVFLGFLIVGAIQYFSSGNTGATNYPTRRRKPRGRDYKQDYKDQYEYEDHEDYGDDY